MGKIYKNNMDKALGKPARDILDVVNDNISAAVLKEILLGESPAGKINVLAGSLIAEEDLWDIALELSESSEARVAFRASWSLEYAYTLMPQEVAKRHEHLIETFIDSCNGSVQRVFGKMICDLLGERKITVTDDTANRLAEKCFDLLISPGTAPAIKVWQIELLSLLSNRIYWIRENLTEVVRVISESSECTPALAARARHFLKRKKNRL